MSNLNDLLPRVLLIDGDDLEAAKLRFASRGKLQLTVEKHPLTAINRVGLEDFDMVVVDPDVDQLLVTEKLLGLLERLRVPIMVLEKESSDVARQLSDSARLRNRVLRQAEFVNSVLATLSA
jgi:PleD family two-component response regulator